MIAELLKKTKERMQTSLDYFKNELKKIRTGRASPSLVEKIEIEYYGTSTPLIQIAAITTPDPRTILIQPWDKSILSEIERVISASDLGISPINDGNAIHLKLPPLTEESREKLVKLVNQQAEQAKISLRNIRHEIYDEVKKQCREGKLSEDDLYYAKDELDKIVKQFENEVESLAKIKESEIREV